MLALVLVLKPAPFTSGLQTCRKALSLSLPVPSLGRRQPHKADANPGQTQHSTDSQDLSKCCLYRASSVRFPSAPLLLRAPLHLECQQSPPVDILTTVICCSCNP